MLAVNERNAEKTRLKEAKQARINAFYEFALSLATKRERTGERGRERGSVLAPAKE